MAHATYKFGAGKAIPYIFGGPNFKIPLSKKPDLTTLYYIGPDFAFDIGIGLENKTKYFIFAPELKYSWGLFNLNPTPSIRSLYFHSISLVLNFKG